MISVNFGSYLLLDHEELEKNKTNFNFAALLVVYDCKRPQPFAAVTCLELADDVE